MLEIFTEPTFPRAALGLECDSVTALALQREGRGRYGVKQAATIEMPNSLITPSFLDRNVHGWEQLQVILEEAVVAAGLVKQKNWSVSLPSNTARSAILTLDSGPKSESSEVLDWKAEQSFGAPAAELRINRTKIANDREGRVRYFATAVKLSVIDEYETVFESLGWKAGLILPKAVSEARWILDDGHKADSLLLSQQDDGFTALLLRGAEPVVIRSVTCADNEVDDEIYRLLMFYNDRFAKRDPEAFLDRLMVVGKNFVPDRIRQISEEALGAAIRILSPDELGLNVPVGSLNFDELAAPAGLAAMGWR